MGTKELRIRLRRFRIGVSTSYKVLKSKKDLKKIYLILEKENFEGVLLVQLDDVVTEAYENTDNTKDAAEWTQFEAANEKSMKYYYQRNATTGGDRTIEKNRIIVMYTSVYDITRRKPELAWSAYSNSKNAINKKDLGNPISML